MYRHHQNNGKRGKKEYRLKEREKDLPCVCERAFS